ncbi:Peptidase S28 family-containing protein [Aphelenchoides besseyi]|nr:Peptidase S28 family-containing protein [Aphelenchoides besseyi]
MSDKLKIVIVFTIMAYNLTVSSMFLSHERANKSAAYYEASTQSRQPSFSESTIFECPQKPLSYEELEFTQPFDHFDSNDNRTFKQRYRIQRHYFEPTVNAQKIILLIGGESPIAINEICLETYPHMKIAAETKSLYLTSDFALADLKNFIENFNNMNNFTAPKTVAIGGSYPGTLAARMRLLHPNHVVGSISSSAPLTPVLNFTNYSKAVELVIRALRPDCAIAIRTAFVDLLTKLKTEVGRSELVKIFRFHPDLNPKELSIIDMNTITTGIYDEFIDIVQNYKDDGRLSGACDLLTSNETNSLKKLSAFYDSVSNNNPIITSFEQSISSLIPTNYSTDTSGGQHDPDTRAWLFMLCNELGWFQPSSPNGMFQDAAPLSYYMNVCDRLFDIDKEEYEKRISRSQKNYGRLDDFNATNVLFIHNAYDPWITLGFKVQIARNHLLSQTIPGKLTTTPVAYYVL